MRKCPKCKIEKNINEYWKTCSYCKECQKEHWRNRINKNKEEYAERRAKIYARKNSHPCKRCDELFIGRREYCSIKCNLLDHVIKRKTGCWEWQGPLTTHGYGQTGDYENGGRHAAAHRLSYRIYKKVK